MKQKINKYLLFLSLLVIGCKYEPRDTVEYPKYNQGDTVTYYEQQYIIAEIDDYYMEINDDTYYWIRPIVCDYENYEMCAFKAREQEITLNK